MSASQSYFPPFEKAVDFFYTAGGVTFKAIRSPRKFFDMYNTDRPEIIYANAPVELAEQDYVSVRGTNIGGQEFEWPEPED
jgi:hypothetical protein